MMDPGSPPSTRREYAGDPRSIGAHLAIDPGELAAHFDSAARAIHAVHGDGGLPTILARENARLKATEGEYVHTATKARAITLRPGARHPAFDAVHEIGHFIDHQGLGSGGYGFASVEEYPAAKKIMDAIYASPQRNALEEESRKTRPGRVKDHLRYLKQPEEMFARAYSRYIAVRGQDPEILSALRWEQRARYGKITHWDEATFEPIAVLFDAMFREIGWSHD